MAKNKDKRAAAYSSFDISDPALPAWVSQNAFSCGGYPYDRRMPRKEYEERLEALQIELIKVQSWVASTQEKVVAIFEGRDAAGKGGVIKRFMAHLNPRQVRVVALPKPTERERGQWYFQRYVEQLPAAGEIALLDRSWYNRAGVEPVLGFCSPEETAEFLEEAPKFEAMLVRSGLRLFKFWLTIGREEQLRRLHARRHDPLKHWKLSSVDLQAIEMWDEYTRARKTMFTETDTTVAPWTVIKANDKRRARLSAMQQFLSALPYDEKDADVIGSADPKIVSSSFADFD